MAQQRSWIADAAARDDWLDQVTEPILDPELEIIDPHHHLWSRAGATYELTELWADTASGHNITKTVYVECGSGYDRDAATAFSPVGETRYVAEIAKQSNADPSKAQIAGIVSHADLRSENLDEILDAHAAASPLFRGIRHSGARDEDPASLKIPGRADAGLYRDPAYQKGVARLGERGLTFDTWHYHHQNRDFLALARAAPDTTLVLDHFGTPLGVGRFAGQHDQIFPQWQKDVAAIADCPNVMAKIGGLAMPDNGFGWHERETPPSSDELADANARWYTHMIDVFGPERCMFESNFPVDRASVSYAVLYNALKKIAAPYTAKDRARMFAGTAQQVYSL